MKKNTASQKIGAQMVAAADGSAFTSSVTVYVTGDAGTQAVGSVGSGACTHEGNGYHTYAPAQAETNYDLVAFTFIGTGAVPATIQIFTAFPQTGDSYARIGAPAGASVSADVASIKTDTGTTIPAALTVIDDFLDTEIAAIKTKTDYLPSATAGAAGGLFIAGTNAATSVSITGNITGNLSGSVGSVTGSVGSVTGSVGSVTGAVGSVTGAVGSVTGSIGSLGATAKSDVNAEVLDVLNTDTFAEPAQGAPGATITLAQKIGYLYKAWRNKATQTATDYKLYNDDAATVDHKATVSDDGTTFTRGEIATGP